MCADTSVYAHVFRASIAVACTIQNFTCDRYTCMHEGLKRMHFHSTYNRVITHSFLCVCVRVCTCVHVCMHVCMCVNVRVYTCVSARVCIKRQNIAA